MTFMTMQDIELAGKRVLIREDFNVPLDDKGNITSDVRIKAALPTIRQALDSGSAVILLSHMGRPTEGQPEERYSLQPVADRLTELLGQPVRLIKNWLDGVDVAEGDVVLCDNVRFNEGEKANDEGLAQQIAALGDVFVMDAFATSHRAQATTHGVACYIPFVCAGPLLAEELTSLEKALQTPKLPLLAIVGGSKVSTKLSVLHSMIDRVDQLILGGGIANTFIAAAGYSVGKSLYEPDLIDEAKQLIAKAEARGARIPIPSDVVVAKEFSKEAEAVIKKVSEVASDELILDVGPETVAEYQRLVKAAATIIWNGPLGVFEFPQFAAGTSALANAIADSSAFSLAGGGDTIAAIDANGVKDKISYISTGGGAFLEFLEGKTLPAVEVLQQRALETHE